MAILPLPTTTIQTLPCPVDTQLFAILLRKVIFVKGNISLESNCLHPMPSLNWLFTAFARASANLRLRLGFGMVMLVACSQLYAGHSSGVELSYECINGCTIRVHFKGYRDCASTITNLPPQNVVAFTADSGCVQPTLIGSWNNISNLEVTPACIGTPTLCNSPSASLNGITEHYWTADYDFCNVNCAEYELSWGICCRNQTINTLYNAQITPIFSSTTVLPFSTPCNNSPTFNYPGTAYLCAGSAYSLSQAATDPDGDSLAYHLGACLSGSGQTVPYLNWINPQAPLGPDWNVSLDSTTGLLAIAPDPSGSNPGSQQVGIVCVYVEEWRNGVLINTVQRDMQLSMISCPANDQPTIPGALNVTGGVATGFNLVSCVGANLCFYVRAFDQDPGQIQTLIWDQSLAAQGATFQLAGNPSVSDTISGVNPSAQFCWTPLVPGSYSFNVQISDDACPLNGLNQYTFNIEVGQNTALAFDSILDCSNASYCALPLTGFPPYTFQWNGSPGINQTDSCFVHPIPGPGTYPYQLVVTDSFGCKALVVDTLEMTNSVVVDAGIDHTICQGDTDTLGGIPDTNAHVVYSWSPGHLLDDSTLANPIFIGPDSNGVSVLYTFVLLATDTLNGCAILDSVAVQVKPSPVSDFALPDHACLNELVVASYLGTPLNGMNFQWNFGAAGSPTYSTGVGPHQVSWALAGNHVVSLVVELGGCVSTTFRDTIVVDDLPVVNIDPVADQCFNGHSFDFSAQGIFDSTATVIWDFGPHGNPSSGIGSPVQGVVFDTSGQHRVTVVVEQNGCYSKIDSIFPELFPDPDASWSVPTGSICLPGDSALFVPGTLNSGATYQWIFQDGLPATSTDDSVWVDFQSPGPKSIKLNVSLNGCLATFIDTVQVYAAPIVDAGPDVSFCELGSGAQLSGTVVQGGPPVVWIWSEDSLQINASLDSIGDDDPLVIADGSGWMYLQIEDSNGCTSPMDSLFLNMIPKPQLTIGPDTFLCGNDTNCIDLSAIVANVNGLPEYTWFPSAGLNDSSLLQPCAHPDSTTTYTLVVTDLGSGCSSSDGGIDSSSQVTVSVNPIPLLEAGPSVSICPGDSAHLSAVAWGAGPNYDFSWSPSSGLSDPSISDPVATPSFTTFYFLQATSNGCPSQMDTLRVEVHPLPFVDAGLDDYICLGESSPLFAIASGDPNATYTYSWSNTQTLDNPQAENPVATPSNTTTYYLVVTSSNGCASNSDSVTVHLRSTPIADAGDSAFVCLGDSLNLQGSFNFSTNDSTVDPNQTDVVWSPGQNMTDPYSLTPGIHPDSSGWYYITSEYQGCRTVDSVYVSSVSTLFPSIDVDLNEICVEDSVRLEAGGGLGGASVQWSPSAGLSHPNQLVTMASPDSTTTYVLHLLEYGCRDSTAATVTVHPSPEAVFSMTDAFGCGPLEVFFASQSTGEAAYIWNWGDQSPIQNQPDLAHTFVEEGRYPVSLTVVSNHGCYDSTLTWVEVLPPPQVNVVSQVGLPAELVLPGAVIELTENLGEAVNWQWIFENGDREGGQTIQHEFYEPGTHWVTLRVSNEDGCWGDSLIGPIVVLAPDLQIPNVFSPNADGINDQFLVDYSGHETFLLQVFDRWGTLLFESRDKLSGWRGIVESGQPVAEGTYFYQLKIGQKGYSGSLTLVR